jgi:hypothetical protein
LQQFLPKPFDTSVWNPLMMEWDTPPALGIVRGGNPFFVADGVEFVRVYLIGEANQIHTVLVGSDPVLVESDDRGYGEFELSSDTAGIIAVSWRGFVLEVAAL